MTALKAFVGMVRAELIKLWRRGFGTAAAVVALVHGLLTFLIMFAIHALSRWGSKTFEGAPTDLFDGIQSGEWTLFALVLPVMAVVVMAVVGELFAGEYTQRTYSLLLLRPVPRWKVFAAKFVASYGFVVALLLVTALVASLLGLAAFGTSRAMVAPGAGLPGGMGLEQSFGLRLLDLLWRFAFISYSMLPIVAATAFLAVVTRSTALTVTYTIILLVIDAGIWLTFPWVSQALDVEVFAQIKPYTLMAARSFMFPWFFGGETTAWELVRESWRALLLTLGYSAAFIGAAIAVFTVQDIE